MKKICATCEAEKDLEYFHKNGKYIRSSCAECENKKHKVLYKNNREQRILQQREYNKNNPGYHLKSRYKRKYGLDMSVYEQMKTEQNGSCKVCKTAETNLKKRLAVDHCHKTGVVRGLLCDSCNRAIGLLKDDVTILQNMINYLNDRVR